MGLETGTYVSDLDAANPVGATDKRHQGDNHLRLIKGVLKTTFPNASRPFRFPSLLAKTANYVILSSDANALILCDTSGGAMSLTLPALASGDAGYEIRASKSTTDTNAVTVVGTINGETNMTISNRYEVLTLFWTGAAWLGIVDDLGFRVALVTNNLTVTEDYLDGVILSTPTGADKTLTLPAIANYRGRTLTVHHTGATYKTTLDGSGAETINGAATLDLTATNMVVTLMAATTGWIVISQIGAATSSASAADVITATDSSKLVVPVSLAPLTLQGTNIASAGTITIPDTGNYFHVTGTTTITDIDFTTTVAGREVTLVFDAKLTLTHHATNLILPTANDITTFPGDAITIRSEGGDIVRVLSYLCADGGSLKNSTYLGSVSTNTGTGSVTLASLDLTRYSWLSMIVAGTSFSYGNIRLKLGNNSGDAVNITRAMPSAGSALAGVERISLDYATHCFCGMDSAITSLVWSGNNCPLTRSSTQLYFEAEPGATLDGGVIYIYGEP